MWRICNKKNVNKFLGNLFNGKIRNKYDGIVIRMNKKKRLPEHPNIVKLIDYGEVRI